MNPINLIQEALKDLQDICQTGMNTYYHNVRQFFIDKSFKRIKYNEEISNGTIENYVEEWITPDNIFKVKINYVLLEKIQWDVEDIGECEVQIKQLSYTVNYDKI